LVNSATHSWGKRRFVTKDMSTNSWWVALLTFGEGWHNNHHAHPVSARHGLKWYEVDMNWYGIWALKKLGLARQVYRVKLSELQRREQEDSKTKTKFKPPGRGHLTTGCCAAVESCHAYQQPPQSHRLLCRARRLPRPAGGWSECWLDHS
jgi:hypothetical protein